MEQYEGSIPHALGIPMGRAEEIAGLVDRLEQTGQKPSTILRQLIEYLSEPKERAYAHILYGIGYGIGHHIEHVTMHVQNTLMQSNPFGQTVKGEA